MRLRLTVIALLALLPAGAHAQGASPESRCTEGPAAVYAVGGSPCRSLAIAAVTMHAACNDEGAHVSCTATLDVVFTAVGGEPIPLPMGELVDDPSRITAITIDGAPWTSGSPLPIAVPGAHLAVHLESRTEADAATITAYSGRAMSDLAEMPPIRVRHFVIAELGAGTRAQLAHLPLGWLDFTRRALGWRAVAIAEIDVETPEGWALRASLVELAFSRSTADVVTNGGPVVTVGGTFDRGARVGAGYEIGFAQGPTSIVIGAHGELLVADQLRGVLALHLELASPSFGIILPSFSSGIGLAVQVAPTPHAALRIIGGITWPFVGATLLIDLYENGDVQTSLMARISL